MADLVGLLKQEQKLLEKRLSALQQAIEALSGDVVKDVKRTVKRGMSEATKQKLRRAAKKRWAAVKKAAS